MIAATAIVLAWYLAIGLALGVVVLIGLRLQREPVDWLAWHATVLLWPLVTWWIVQAALSGADRRK